MVKRKVASMVINSPGRSDMYIGPLGIATLPGGEYLDPDDYFGDWDEIAVDTTPR